MDKLPGANLGDVLDTGFYVAAIAALVGFVSSFMPAVRTRGRQVETRSAVEDREAVYDDRRI